MSAPLSQYVRDCLAEDKFGHAYVDGLDRRMGTLNYAQLIDITNVLAENAEGAKSTTWKRANIHILQSVYKHFVPKHQQAVVGETAATRRGRKGLAQKKRRAKAEYERRAVMDQVREQVLVQARAEVDAGERKRRVDEKEKELEHIKRAHERQWKLYIACAAYLGLFVLIVGVSTADVLIIVLCVLVAVLTTSIGVWLTYRMSRFRRIAVSDEDLERASFELSERLFVEMMSRFKSNERAFKGKMREEKEDRRRARLALAVALEAEAAEAVGGGAVNEFPDLEAQLPGEDDGEDNNHILSSADESDNISRIESAFVSGVVPSAPPCASVQGGGRSGADAETRNGDAEAGPANEDV